jgi:outer membrane protein TolC
MWSWKTSDFIKNKMSTLFIPLKIVVTITLLALPTIRINAQTDTLQLTISQAKALALTNNKSIRTARIDAEIAKKKVIETTAIGLPQATVTGNYTHIFDLPSLDFGSGGLSPSELGYMEGLTQEKINDNLWSYSVAGPKIPLGVKDNTTFDFQVTQLIFSGEYLVGLRAAKVYKLLSEQNIKKNELDVTQSIEETYCMAVLVAENLKIVEEMHQATASTLKEIEMMHAEGFTEDTDVDQMKINLSSLNSLAISLKGQVKNITNLLKYQMGIERTTELNLLETPNQLISSISAPVAQKFAPELNIDYKMMQTQVEMQKLSLKREKSTFLPVLAAYYNHQEKLKKPEFDFNPKDVVGVSLTIPIFTSTQRLMKVKQASLNLQKTEILHQQLTEGLNLQYDNLSLEYETAFNNFMTQQESKNLSQKIFEKTTIKFKEGISSSLELTQAQTQYLNSAGNYYTSLLTLLATRSKLNRLIAVNQ